LRPSIARVNVQLDRGMQLANTPPLQSTTPGLHPVSFHQMAPPMRGNTSDYSLLLSLSTSFVEEEWSLWNVCWLNVADVQWYLRRFQRLFARPNKNQLQPGFTSPIHRVPQWRQTWRVSWRQQFVVDVMYDVTSRRRLSGLWTVHSWQRASSIHRFVAYCQRIIKYSRRDMQQS